ncbi:YkvI family membrane protein [Cytobacillus sp. FSL H8-0458]|uniref:YkvI family membrane protein n=1 Tax=Cytobacillus sp. FSL H8-0458 TaxID=2975346 RepID=UPI0030FA5040
MNNTFKIIVLAGAFVSFILGGGTATGQEILQFFVSFGYLGIGAIIIAAVLHMWFGAYAMDVGLKLKAEDSKDVFIYFCGKYLGLFFYWFAQLFILIVFVVMISGAGATVSEHFGLGIVAGRAIMAIAVLITALFRLETIIKILGIAGPIIVLFAVIVGIGNFESAGFSQAGDIVKELNLSKATSDWWQAGFIYSSFVLLVALPFLANLGKGEVKRSNVIIGGSLGGLIMLIGVFAIYIGILSNIENLHTKAIPTLVLADQISPALATIYSIILLIAIYTTAVGMLWTVAKQFSKDNLSKYRILVVTLTILGFFGGLFPFAKIIDLVYPIVGYIGLILMVGMLYRQFINKGKLESATSTTVNIDKNLSE